MLSTAGPTIGWRLQNDYGATIAAMKEFGGERSRCLFLPSKSHFDDLFFVLSAAHLFLST
jgi:hypothetical protein